ncbi:methyltransferase family protein [Dactylosporangium matsuzakiense]|uniref:Membrane protein n=1 Tax=Dactylosporangium matsuzakiense TaxID=53360 RepID=A0A9W6KL64_9ACTN|nr:isoprenylcysteine carboxylmethyltransferase family protein [Dactylosporangium matsuzakiense]UWZ48177.1 isoprenylcysteine carboxylmethyltransferase family protein [Dactylosporangium matsuzakiense]GLL03198.1 membrane protein [Dactylosporangium matsuzakiense]
MQRIYRAVVYAAFLANLAYTIGFLAGPGVLVPKGIDDGPPAPAELAVLVDGALLAVFAVQHSVMARPWFKRRFTKPSIERSTYVLASTAAVTLLLWQWRPLPQVVWSAGPGWARALLWTLYGAGWLIVAVSTFGLGHRELFGLRAPGRAELREPWQYRLVRHPIMTGFLVAFWAVPHMSVGRLVFAVAATGYIVVGTRFEEHDLREQLGAPYADYARRVPRFIPGTKGGRRWRRDSSSISA